MPVIFGLAAVAYGLFLVLQPSWFRSYVRFFPAKVPAHSMRLIGVFAIALGLYMIYLGL